MILAGLDYSMSSPAVVLYDTETAIHTFHSYTTAKKLNWHHPFYGYPHKKWKTNEERFDQISDWALSIVAGCSHVFMEGYAYGAKGLVFNIGENGGVLKHKLFKAGIPFTIFAPSAVKKHATTKGNANKQMMELAFTKATGYDIKKELNQRDKDENPSSDIADAYWILELGRTSLEESDLI